MRTVSLIVLCLVLPFAAGAQTSLRPAPSVLTADTPIKTELEKIFGGLQDQLKEIDTLAAKLKATTNRRPEDTQVQINGAAQTLSALADRLQPTGDLAAQLSALRNAAALHRQRVQDMAKDSIDEADRTALLKAWDKALIDTDKTGVALGEMRDRLTHALAKLRMRQTAVGEYLLAGQYQAAVATLRSWLGDLDATVKSLHQAMDPARPGT